MCSRSDTKHEAGVGFLPSNKVRDRLLGCQPVRPRIMVTCFQVQPFNLSIVQVYAPIADSREADSDAFYNDLQLTQAELTH
jgi:hypothetical protein